MYGIYLIVNIRDQKFVVCNLSLLTENPIILLWLNFTFIYFLSGLRKYYLWYKRRCRLRLYEIYSRKGLAEDRPTLTHSILLWTSSNFVLSLSWWLIRAVALHLLQNPVQTRTFFSIQTTSLGSTGDLCIARDLPFMEMFCIMWLNVCCFAFLVYTSHVSFFSLPILTFGWALVTFYCS